jgi:hypothetical protein
MSSTVRYVFKNNRIREANSEELAAILHEENEEPDVRNLRVANEKKDAIFQDIRAERDALLSKSDWTQFPDSPLTTTQKTAWSTYRQELRDFPSTFLDDNDDILVTILTPTWPTEPT